MSRACQEALPGDFARLKLHADAVEAYALAKGGRLDRARQIVGRWPSEEDACKVKKYWGNYPGGTEGSDAWAGLPGESTKTSTFRVRPGEPR